MYVYTLCGAFLGMGISNIQWNIRASFWHSAIDHEYLHWLYQPRIQTKASSSITWRWWCLGATNKLTAAFLVKMHYCASDIRVIYGFGGHFVFPAKKAQGVLSTQHHGRRPPLMWLKRHAVSLRSTNELKNSNKNSFSYHYRNSKSRRHKVNIASWNIFK